jgi:hypothetical protein
MIADDLLPVTVLAAVLSALALLACLRERVQADEGYLWYGALQTLAGEVPLRDFRSYEPGRYYWCALWMLVLGRGIAALRVAVHAFFFVGLACGLLGLRLGGVEWPAVITAGIVLTVWAHPHYKLFEPAIAMVAVLAGVALLTDPEPATILLAGVVAGGSAFFGVNYALYSGAALLGLTLLVGLKSGEVGLLPGLGAYFAGAALGASPLLILGVLVRGVFPALFERRVRRLLARGASNLPLPVPWPWRTSERGRAGQPFVGIYFLLLPAFAWSVAVWAVLAPWADVQSEAAVVSAGAVGTFGLHHAFSRAGLTHLAQSMPPFILGLTALLGHGLGWAALAVLLGWGTAATVLTVHPRLLRRRRRNKYVRRDIGGSPLWIPRREARILDTVRLVVERHLEPADPLFAVPTLTALHPMLDRRSAVYDTFCVYPASEGEQRMMLRSIEEQRVRLAVVHDHPLDGRGDLRFSRTHPAVWSHLGSEFEPLDLPDLPADYHVLRRA